MAVDEMAQGCVHLVFINETGRADDGVYWASLLVFIAEDAETDLKELMCYMRLQFLSNELPSAIWHLVQRGIEKDES
jgi:hypothetical protein